MDDDLFNEDIEPENDVNQQEVHVVPLGEMVFHQVMTAVSSSLFDFVQVLNELGTVKLMAEPNMRMILDLGETDE